MRAVEPRSRAAVAWILGVIVLLSGSIASFPSVGAASGSVPAALRSAIFVKALSYEKRIKAGSGPLVIAVVGPRSGSGSSDASAMAGALGKLTKAGIGKRKGQVVRIAELDLDSAAAAVKSKRAEVVYVADGLGSRAASLASRLGSGTSLVLCGDPNTVGSGCAMSVETSGKGSQLVIDIRAAKKSGFEFDPRMLRLARVVK